MKRPDLSLATIAGALALLGTPALIASCAKSAPAENATNEPARVVAPAASAAPSAQTITGTITPSAASPATNASAMVGDASAVDRRAAPGKPTGMASCGAGTCTADPKKKK